MIEQEDWTWFGLPKHYIKADECDFRLGTKVGDWIVSTVGQRRPNNMDKEDHDVKLNPDDILMQEIAPGRFFETKVFEAESVNCNCCKWSINVEKDRYDFPGGAYDTAQEAREGHTEVCKYIAKNQ